MAVVLRGAHIWDADPTWRGVRDLVIGRGRILERAPHTARIIDCDGLTIVPGFINAHDHLELNHYPRTKFRERYDNAHQWGADVNARLNDAPFKRLRAFPLRDRLFIGGLKNLLSGATTVVHHNPLHRPLKRPDFPVRVLRRYGWAHSLHFETSAAIKRAYQRTPDDAHFFIHLAEGTDNLAADEFRQCNALSCATSKTVLIHGVGLPAETVPIAAGQVRALVTCPTTNQYLLGQRLNWDIWRPYRERLLLGSDSRLTAEGDLLDEMRVISDWFNQEGLWTLVTHQSAGLLKLANVGHLRPGARADLIIQPGKSRAEHGLVMLGGAPRIGDPALMRRFDEVRQSEALLDGIPKRLHRSLARRYQASTLKESDFSVR